MVDMPVRLHHIVIDAHDLPSLASFWAEALGWTVLSARESEVVVGPSIDASVGLCFMPAGAINKTVKNRVHLDLTTTAEDRDAEIERLLDLGARRVDIGQTGEESWEVWLTPKETSSASFARRPLSWTESAPSSYFAARSLAAVRRGLSGRDVGRPRLMGRRSLKRPTCGVSCCLPTRSRTVGTVGLSGTSTPALAANHGPL
jgi:hypothetical protein